jgi:hypothetical protein
MALWLVALSLCSAPFGSIASCPARPIHSHPASLWFGGQYFYRFSDGYVPRPSLRQAVSINRHSELALDLLKSK